MRLPACVASNNRIITAIDALSTLENCRANYTPKQECVRPRLPTRYAVFRVISQLQMRTK